MAELKRSKHYNDWLTFVEKVKDNKTEFGKTPYTIGGVATRLERATIVSAYGISVHTTPSHAVSFFDNALNRFYSHDDSPMFKGVYEEMQQDNISDACAIFVLLSISTYASSAIAWYRVTNNQDIYKISFDDLYRNVSDDIEISNILLFDASASDTIAQPISKILTDKDLEAILPKYNQLI